MKKKKRKLIHRMIQDLITESMEFGAARQRHQDAATDEHELGESVKEIATDLVVLLSGEDDGEETVH